MSTSNGVSEHPALVTAPAEGAGTRDITRLAAGAGISLTGKLLGRGIHVLGQVLLARLLGPASFGLYAIGWTLLRVFGLIAPLGLDRAIIRFVPRYWRRDASGLRSVLLQSFRWAILSGIAVGGALFVGAPWLAERVFHKPDLTIVIRVFSLAFPLMTGLQVAAAATRATKHMKYSVYALEIGQPSANLALVLLVVATGWGLSGAVAAAVLSFGLAFGLAAYYVKSLYPEAFRSGLDTFPLSRELFAFSVPASLAGMSVMLSLWVDRLLVGYFRPAADVGVYQACSQVAMVFAVILSAFNTILSPYIADLYQERQLDRLRQLYRVGTRWGLYLSLLVFLVLAVASRDILSVVFGAAYSEGWKALVILASGQLAIAATGATAALMVMTGHQKRWFVLTSSALLLNTLLNVLLVPRWGNEGAATATALSMGSLSLLGVLQVRQVLHLWPYDRRYAKGILATAVSVLVVMLLHAGGIDGPFWNVLAASVSFPVSLWLFGLEVEDREIVALVGTKLRMSLLEPQQGPSS